MFRNSSNGNITGKLKKRANYSQLIICMTHPCFDLGNEVIAYGYPGMLEDEQADSLAAGNAQSEIGLAALEEEEGSVDLLDLLGDAQTPVASTTTTTASKKRKRN